jgi:hypothetical protein
MGTSALAFEETTIGTGDAKASAAPGMELPKDAAGQSKGLPDPSKGLSLTPEIQLTPPGTEVRIPGLGTVGVLPKLDFGLELLYGANDQKTPFPDKSGSDDVQLRGTIKHRF